MNYHYKGKLLINVDVWAEDDDDAIDEVLLQTRNFKHGKDNILDYDLEIVEEDSSDDEDYYRDMEFDNWREREEE